MVATKQVRFALLGDGSPGIGNAFAAPRLLGEWIRAHGRVIDPTEWYSLGSNPAWPPAGRLDVQLYDLRSDSGG
jgi:hypothetical protein